MLISGDCKAFADLLSVQSVGRAFEGLPLLPVKGFRTLLLHGHLQRFRAYITPL